MSPTGSIVLAAVAAYFLGAVPFGLLIARYWHKIDVRQHGSGNIGATNVGRVLGRKWGIICLLLDALKGFVPTLLFPWWFGVEPEWQSTAKVACGAAAIAGHVFPIWLGFRGGKGVATGAGVAAVVAWPAALAALAVFAITFAAKRIVSLSSIAAAIVYAIVALVLIDEPFSAHRLPLVLFAITVPALIIVRHRDNIVRLLRGEERRFDVGDRRDQRETTTNTDS